MPLLIDFSPDVELGTDDSNPTHYLLIDRETRKLYLGTPRQVNHILTSQHPPRQPVQLTPEQWQELVKQLNEGLRNLPTPSVAEIEAQLEAQQQGIQELIEWLDSQVTIESQDEFHSRAEQGDIEAAFTVNSIRSMHEPGN